MIKLVFLTDDFYTDYAKYPEIERKQTRPHACASFFVAGKLCCVPLRSNINHPYAIWTDKENHCGLDFSKTVVITDTEKYIDKTARPYLRKAEYKVFQTISRHDMQVVMERYLKQYRRAKARADIPRNKQFLECSCLQYFESDFEL